MSSRVHDAIVVGGRVAGAATAMLLARRGARVLVLDSGERGGDTLSTHFIWPRGARLLDEWGLLPALVDESTPLIDRVGFEPGPTLIEARLPSPALCPRRTVLDRVLVDAAVAAGADVRHGVSVEGLLEEAGRVVGVRHRGGVDRAPLVIGADGRASTVARLAGAATVESAPPLTCGFYAYFEGLPTDGAEFRFRDQRLTYLWTTNAGLGLAYVATTPDRLPELRAQVRVGLHEAAVAVEAVRARLRQARRVSPTRGFANQGPFRRRRHGPGWILVGDAACFKDPTSGMGISEALTDAAWIDSVAASGTLDPGPTLAEREVAAEAVYRFSCQAADLRPPDARLAATYRAVAADPVWSLEFMRMLGADQTPQQFMGAFAARRTAPGAQPAAASASRAVAP